MKSRANRFSWISAAIIFVASAVPLVAPGAPLAAAAVAVGDDDVVTAAAPGPDPDTTAAIVNGKPRYVTVTTTSKAGPACENRFAWIPYYVHGDNNEVGLDGVCPVGDLLGNTTRGEWIDVRWEGKEAERRRGLWAPSIFFYDDEFYLHYAGVVKGTGQRCIWAVRAPSLGELKFAPRKLFACPGDRADNAIDPDMFEHNGRLFVTYRDDGGNISPQASAIYVTEVNRDGLPIGSRQRLLLSADVPWTHYQVMPGIADQVVENPSLVYSDATEEWLLFYSGNGYTYATYATGIASCGRSIMKGPRCKPIGGARRAYIGFGGEAPPWGETPKYKMPGNLHGSAGLSAFKTHYGGYAAVWHAWDSGAPTRPGDFGPVGVPGLQGAKRSLHASSLILPTKAAPALVRFRAGPIGARQCKNRYATVDLSLGQTPTGGDDVIVGTAGDDVIDGLGGDDLICGWGGADVIAGGSGNDTIYGGRGADLLHGNRGDDVIYGGAGPDQMSGGFGTDVCRGSAGRDGYTRCSSSLSATPLESEVQMGSSALVGGDAAPAAGEVHEEIVEVDDGDAEIDGPELDDNGEAVDDDVDGKAVDVDGEDAVGDQDDTVDDPVFTIHRSEFDDGVSEALDLDDVEIDSDVSEDSNGELEPPADIPGDAPNVEVVPDPEAQAEPTEAPTE